MDGQACGRESVAPAPAKFNPRPRKHPAPVPPFLLSVALPMTFCREKAGRFSPENVITKGHCRRPPRCSASFVEAEPPPEEGSGGRPPALASGNEAASGPEAAARSVVNSQAL